MSDTPDPAPAGSGEGTHGRFVFRQLLDEVYLLLDFVSTRPEKSLEALAEVPLPPGAMAQGQPQSLQDVLAHVMTLRFPPGGRGEETARDAAFLLAVKDRLTREARPATGATVAFTSMVISSERQPALEPEAREAPRRPRSMRHTLAANAYPGLQTSARCLRRALKVAVLLLILLTVLNVFTSGVVSYGRSLIEQLAQGQQAYRAAQDVIKSVETRGAAPAAVPAGGGGDYVPYCDRVKLPPEPGGIRRFEDGQQAILCSSLNDADVEIAVARQRLRMFQANFQEPFLWFVQLGGWLKLDGERPDCKDPKSIHCHPPLAERPEKSASDFIAGLANYLLPFCFTLLGAGVAILRDLYAKMRESTLGPRDLPLSLGRLVLGMVAGAAIGLLYTPTDASGAIAGLSAQGLAFLAGYGVDAVFRWVDARVETAFKPAAG